MKFTFSILLSIVLCFYNISNVKAQKLANEQYKSSKLSVSNFTVLAEEERANPPIIAKKRIGNKESEKENYDLTIPTEATPRVFDIKAPRNSYHKDGEEPNSPPPLLNFLGLDDNASTIPPDTHGAVGPNHLVVALNSQVRISDKSGNMISTVSLQSFWSDVSASGAFDPKIYYDIYENRWFIVAADDGFTNNSGILVAASQTDDPTGNWNTYKIEADVSNNQWFDYPGVGINKDWIVITGNMFELNNSGLPSSNKLFVFSKDEIYTGAADLNVSTFSNVSPGFSTMMPAITYDNTTDKIYMLQNWNGASGFYRLSKIEGTSTPSFSEVAFVGVGDSWASFVTSDFAPQAGTSQKINNGGGRILDAVYRAETGTFWACHNVFLPLSTSSRTAIQWLEIDPDENDNGTDGDVAVRQLGRIDGEGTGENGNDIFYAYPSIAVNSQGDMVIGFSSFSEDQFASTGYAVRFNDDPLGFTQAPLIFKDGLGPYFKTFGSTRNRWGDYSMTCVDTDDTNIWTLQEFADVPVGGGDGSGRWGVQWAQIALDGSTAIGLPSVSDNTLCINQDFEVGAGIIGTFESDNVFSVELSDINGEFSAPLSIGSASSLPIVASIPASISPGNNYRIRVKSSNPATSSEANPQAITISSPPTSHASAISIDSSTPREMRISWNSGNGENRLVLMKEGADFLPEDLPVDGISYTASSTFSLSPIGSNNTSVVYRGSNNSVKVSNLEVGKTYFVAIVEYACDPPIYFLENLPTTSSVVTNLEAELIRNITAYPNPTRGTLTIDFGSTPQDIKLNLQDAQGKSIDQRLLKDKKTTTYNLEKLPKGLYFLKISSGKAAITKKVIVE